MGQPGRHPLLGRRLHRPPRLRTGRRGAAARSRGLPRGDRPAAQLARRPARFHQAGTAAPLLRRLGRSDGFDGEPLHGQPPAAPRRRLHAGRQGGIPPRPCRDGLHADPQTAVSPRPGGRRRHRGLAAPPDPLRLLERLAQALGAGRVGRRPADLRHGRTGRAAGGPGAAQRLQRQAAAPHPAGSLPRRRKLCRAARPRRDDPPALLRGVRARQTGLRGELHGDRDPEQSHGTGGDARGTHGRPVRRRDASQRDAHDRRAGPLVRPPLRTRPAPALPRQGRHSGVGDDQVLGQYPPGLLRRLLVLYDFRPSGQVHQLAQRAVDPRRSAARRRHARIQGLPLGRRGPLGQHVPHGRPRPGAVPQVPPPVVPPPRQVSQPLQRPPAVAGALRKDPRGEGHQKGLHRQRHPLRPVRRTRLSGDGAEAPHLGPAQGGARAHGGQRTETHAETAVRTLRAAQCGFPPHLR